MERAILTQGLPQSAAMEAHETLPPAQPLLPKPVQTSPQELHQFYLPPNKPSQQDRQNQADGIQLAPPSGTATTVPQQPLPVYNSPLQIHNKYDYLLIKFSISIQEKYLLMWNGQFRINTNKSQHFIFTLKLLQMFVCQYLSKITAIDSNCPVNNTTNKVFFSCSEFFSLFLNAQRRTFKSCLAQTPKRLH